jgi:hypothetical protein
MHVKCLLETISCPYLAPHNSHRKHGHTTSLLKPVGEASIAEKGDATTQTGPCVPMAS